MIISNFIKRMLTGLKQYYIPQTNNDSGNTNFNIGKDNSKNTKSIAKTSETEQTSKPYKKHDEELALNIARDFILVNDIAKDLMDIDDSELNRPSAKKWVIDQRISAIKNGDISAQDPLTKKQALSFFKSAIDKENGDATAVRKIFALSTEENQELFTKVATGNKITKDYSVEEIEMAPTEFDRYLSSLHAAWLKDEPSFA